jgi:dGTPase
MGNAPDSRGDVSAAATDGLAAFAVHPGESHGRLVDELASATRTPFQRDRDRIVHCTAFRRLNYKTQVFVFHEGDHYRSRLTHSLEVAQIARSIARTLQLDEDLAEAIALAHDLGHPPFGHAGEQALDAAMADFGGFDHNAQSLAVVTALERKYAAFDGLNLTWETLEGLVKHNGPLLDTAGHPSGAYTEKGVPQVIADYCRGHDLELARHPSAEAQVAALADDIAYSNHDIDDGFRAGLCRVEDLQQVPLTARILDEVRTRYPELESRRLIYEINRRLITAMVDDVVAETRARLAKLAPKSADDIRDAATPVVAFSNKMGGKCEELRFYLFSWVYRDEKVMQVMNDAKRIVRDLFARYRDDPAALPEHWRARTERGDEQAFARQVCDFIAGMTDRFAIEEHSRLFDDTPDLR